FPVAVVDNDLLDGTKTAQIRVWTKATGVNTRIAEGTPDTLTITDDDGPALRLVLAASVVGEGASPATTATMTRNGATNSALTVFLQSSDTTEATVPPSVIIPAGATFATFPIATINDSVEDGSQSVTFTASATDYASATARLIVSDVNQPDLIVSAVSAPA